MITYICRNRDQKTGRELPCTNTVCQTSVCPSCGGRAQAFSEIYWCSSCQVPVYEEECPVCKEKGKRIATDLRPVFPQERLLLEIILGEPFAFLEKSVWNGTGNRYYVNGKRISFSVKDLKTLNIEEIWQEYRHHQKKNTDIYFLSQIKKFTEANQRRYEEIVGEAEEYIREAAKDYGVMDMFVSFSGGKDSTVTSDLVMRALGNPKILHIFGDTTLEFPFTYEYVERFKKAHPQTPLITAKNKEKDFENLCRLIGPPSRVMRWCCTVFKTGSIQKTIKSLFRGKRREKSISTTPTVLATREWDAGAVQTTADGRNFCQKSTCGSRARLFATCFWTLPDRSGKKTPRSMWMKDTGKQGRAATGWSMRKNPSCPSNPAPSRRMSTIMNCKGR